MCYEFLFMYIKFLDDDHSNSAVLDSATLQTVACQAPLSMGLSTTEEWPFPPPRNYLNPGIETGSPALQADSLQSEPPGKPSVCIVPCKF